MVQLASTFQGFSDGSAPRRHAILPGNAGDLPLLGFGLWRLPIVPIPLEALLFLAGVFLYWRAARSVGPRPGRRVTPARAAAALLASGTIVLLLDALGI